MKYWFKSYIPTRTGHGWMHRSYWRWGWDGGVQKERIPPENATENLEAKDPLNCRYAYRTWASDDGCYAQKMTRENRRGGWGLHKSYYNTETRNIQSWSRLQREIREGYPWPFLPINEIGKVYIRAQAKNIIRIIRPKESVWAPLSISMGPTLDNKWQKD